MRGESMHYISDKVEKWGKIGIRCIRCIGLTVVVIILVSCAQLDDSIDNGTDNSSVILDDSKMDTSTVVSPLPDASIDLPTNTDDDLDTGTTTDFESVGGTEMEADIETESGNDVDTISEPESDSGPEGEIELDAGHGTDTESDSETETETVTETETDSETETSPDTDTGPKGERTCPEPYECRVYCNVGTGIPHFEYSCPLLMTCCYYFW